MSNKYFMTGHSALRMSTSRHRDVMRSLCFGEKGKVVSVVKVTGACEVAQPLKIAAKPDGLSSVPRTHVVEAENQPQQVVLHPPRAHSGNERTHTHI